VDILMAATADDEGLATACCHLLSPFGLFDSPSGVEVFQASSMVRFDVCVLLAEFAPTGYQSANEFRRSLTPDYRKLIFEDDLRGSAR
jgi:hypothetical protein